MCVICGLPATHTGATTILLSSMLPVFLVYINAWFISSKLYPFFARSKKGIDGEQGISKKVSIKSVVVTLSIFSLIVLAPFWSEWFYWNSTNRITILVLDTIGPKVFAAAVCLIGSLTYAVKYFWGRRSRFDIHFAILLMIEALLLYFLIAY